MSPYPSWRREGFVISSDPSAIDLDGVVGFLQQSYWAADVSRADLERSFAASQVYSLRADPGGAQIGFARVVTDGVRIAWLSDVFVLEGYRGRGLATWLIQSAMADPRHPRVRRWLLATADAHPLYRRCGWAAVPAGRYMSYPPQPEQPPR